MSACTQPQTPISTPQPITLSPLKVPIDKLGCALIDGPVRHELTGEELAQAQRALKAIFADPGLVTTASDAKTLTVYSIEYRDPDSGVVITTLRYYGPLAVLNTDRFVVELSHIGRLLVPRSIIDDLGGLKQHFNIGRVVE